MNPRVEYEMSQEDFDRILNACRPTPVMFLSGGLSIGGNPQENANHAWRLLGERMGFDSMTVRPIAGRDGRFFTAVPLETKEQSDARKRREAAAKRAAEISRHEIAIKEHQAELDKLMNESNDKSKARNAGGGDE